MGLSHSKSSKNSGLILEIPYQNPVSSINYSDKILYVGTYNGMLYKLDLGAKEGIVRFELSVKPSYPIRYIHIISKENDKAVGSKKPIITHGNLNNNFNEFSILDGSSRSRLETKKEVELLLGGSFKTIVDSFDKPNSPISHVLDKFSISPDMHYQITEISSNMFTGDCGNNNGNKNHKKLRDIGYRKDNTTNNCIPLFLISSLIDSYLGFSTRKGCSEEITLKSCNYFIPDKELVVLDYDYVCNQLLIVERSPERLDYHNLCSLQIIDLNHNNIVTDESESESLLNKPLKYVLNFPYKPHFLVNRSIIQELTFSSSIEYKKTNEGRIHYQYNYSTVFLMSNFKKNKLFKYKTMYNVSNAKFWNQNSIVVVISNHLIANILVSYVSKNTNNHLNNINFVTYSKNNFIVKSPDDNYTAISTSNSSYLVALTEKSRLLIYNKKGEIVHNIRNVLPHKYQFKWVWPINIFVSRDGFIIFNAFNGVYCVKCDILSLNHKHII